MRRILTGSGITVMCACAVIPVCAEPSPGRLPDPDCAVVVPASPADVPAPDDVPESLAVAHRFATGAGVRVAVIDTGVTPHPRLPPVIPGGDLVVVGERREDEPPLPDGAVDDCDGHGTIVAGILAAHPSPDDGVVGVAPGVELISIRQTSSRRAAKTVGAGGSLASLTDAINLALDGGARVINISLVSCLPPGTADRVDTHDFDAALARAEEHGTVIVAAAGNKDERCPAGSTVLPAHRPTVVSVSSLDTARTIAEYSIDGPGPLLSAPGRVPLALSPDGVGFTVGLAESSGPREFEGTSFSAPVISGTAALLMELHPADSAAGIRARLAGAVDPATGAVDPAEAVTHLPADYRGIPHPVTVTAPVEPPDGVRVRTGVTVTILLCAVGLMLTIRYTARFRLRRTGRHAGQ
ncbi:S8 family serine peptidase [Corynebacterium sp. P6145]|uniref:S8 family serine peptidase n=1 Tax=Corynebacterium antarcticum TaxID=2800405 RepID=UPI002002C8C7|nr:S8 family serine peptidase [Corynebacterium antarcticum]MCK7642339.1 S8 family serine peptidase [Corynebacterium antarcticum]MCX7491820.1 S8 family serine peptidase [Corynebacterium antarcticum]